MMTNRDSPSSMAFLTARSPSLTASLIWVSVCLLGPLMSRVTERGFSHFSMNVYFSSPCAKQSQVCLSATCFSSVCTNEFTACFQARFCTDSTLMRSSRTLFHFSQAMTGANIQADVHSQVDLKYFISILQLYCSNTQTLTRVYS